LDKKRKKHTNLKVVSSRKIDKIIKDIGPDRYRIYFHGNISDSLTPLTNKISEITLVACSGTTADYHYKDSERTLTIPSDSQVILIRSLRLCDHDGNAHYNADDSIIFPTEAGSYLRIPRAESPDHYIGLAKVSGSLSIADAYRLPTQDKGPIAKYTENGALWPIEFYLKKGDDNQS